MKHALCKHVQKQLHCSAMQVWPVLYACMGTAAWRVWNRGGFAGQTAPLAMYAAQLALNLAWPPLFFKAHKLGTAAVESTGMACVAALMLCTLPHNTLILCNCLQRCCAQQLPQPSCLGKWTPQRAISWLLTLSGWPTPLLSQPGFGTPILVLGALLSSRCSLAPPKRRQLSGICSDPS